MANEHNFKPFSKNDPRINRAGRPKNYDLIHEIAVRLCAEPSNLEGDPDGMTHNERTTTGVQRSDIREY